MIARWRPSWMDVNTWSISPPTCETIALTAATLPSTSVVSLRRGEEYGDGSQVDAPFQKIKLGLELFQCWQPAKAGHYYGQTLIWAISKVNLASLGS